MVRSSSFFLPFLLCFALWRAHIDILSVLFFIREDRKEQVQHSMAAKQKKRTDNIATRNERRNDKRKGVKVKNKARPGFEGKSFGKGGKGGKGKAPAKGGKK